MHGCEFEPPMRAQILPDGFHCHMYHWRIQPANIPENLDFECVSVSETRKFNQQNSDLGHATGKCLPGIGSGDVSKWCLKQSWGQGCGQDMVHKIMTVNNGYIYIYLI